MPAQSWFTILLRLACGGLKTVGAWAPAPRYGQRLADAQQIILVRGLCDRLPPGRKGEGK